ncbi:HNH endonuclease signature motif containing protein [Kocuria rosea]|uniref:HNH endonuclease signature motif containing protein n=1 Tax=Kocuria rosea TaxID=1275 RepID=UPI0010A3F9B4|nr:HNH endonuclease signature motif containing protein [Kocuria rosea]THE18127.1 HNH endonuclease [Kocuria rosea]
MTTTAHRRARPAPGPHRAAPAGERVLDAGVRAEVRAVVGELVDSAAAQAREAGRQLRCIVRLWLLAWEDHEIDWVSTAGLMPYEADELVCSLLETEDQMVRDLADEIGPALRLPAGTALGRVREALVLGLHLPEVLEALEAGLFSARHASVIADQWRELVEDVPAGQEAPSAVVQRLAAELVERAPHCTVAQLRAWARRRRAALLAGTQEARHRAARAGRRVWVEHGEDGMAWLHALLDAPTALAVQDRLDTLASLLEPVEETARAGTEREPDRCGPAQFGPVQFGPVQFGPVQFGPEEDGPDGFAPGARTARTDAQLRADVLTDLLLEGELPDDPGFPRGVRGRVCVTVPVLTLLGCRPGGPAAGVPADAPVLEGHGPISADVARKLAAGASSWHRVLTHPVTGAVLDHDRTTYAVPADLRRRLRLRDGTCRFPGCRRRAERCDLDHTVAWQDGGRTAADNLAHLCRHHHHLVKHRRGALGRWSVRQPGPAPAGGVLEWTSPAGRTYRTVPDPSAGATSVGATSGGATSGGPVPDVGERGSSVPEDADPPPF